MIPFFSARQIPNLTSQTRMELNLTPQEKP